MTEPPPTKLRESEPPLPDKVIAIDEALAEAKIPHAIGGALALAYYAEPRATIDVDVNVFVGTDRQGPVMEALDAIGIATDELDVDALKRDGQCRLWWGDNPVDLFFAYDPFHQEMRREARRVPFGGTMIPILAPEHLAVCKAMFDRPKDWLDIEQMLIATDELDVDQIEGWLGRMVGRDDRRVAHLAELRARVPTPDGT
jgi:hypothetical protein